MVSTDIICIPFEYIKTEIVVIIIIKYSKQLQNRSGSIVTVKAAIGCWWRWLQKVIITQRLLLLDLEYVLIIELVYVMYIYFIARNMNLHICIDRNVSFY